MKITRRQLRRIIREAEGSTKKYDDDSALKGGQSKLPDGLQKSIIDKTVEDREESEEEKEISERILRRIVREEVEKAAPFGSGMEQAELDPDQKEIVGHT